jgi:hypothetical protein
MVLEASSGGSSSLAYLSELRTTFVVALAAKPQQTL